MPKNIEPVTVIHSGAPLSDEALLDRLYTKVLLLAVKEHTKCRTVEIEKIIGATTNKRVSSTSTFLCDTPKAGRFRHFGKEKKQFLLSYLNRKENTELKTKILNGDMIKCTFQKNPQIFTEEIQQKIIGVDGNVDGNVIFNAFANNVTKDLWVNNQDAANKRDLNGKNKRSQQTQEPLIEEEEERLETKKRIKDIKDNGATTMIKHTIDIGGRPKEETGPDPKGISSLIGGMVGCQFLLFSPAPTPTPALVPATPALVPTTPTIQVDEEERAAQLLFGMKRD